MWQALGVRDCRCFPHVVNLACKAVLAAITNMDFTADDAEDYNPSGTATDPIATSVASAQLSFFSAFLWLFRYRECGD